MQINYSPNEQKVLKLLTARPQNSVTLCEKFYQPEKPPYYGRQIIIGLMSSLMRKTKLNKEPFKVHKSKRGGPHPISFWKEQ